MWRYNCASSRSSCFRLKPRPPEGQQVSPAGCDIFAFSFLGCHAGWATSGGSFDIAEHRLSLKHVPESLHTQPGTVDAVIEMLVRRFTFTKEVATEHPEAGASCVRGHWSDGDNDMTIDSKFGALDLVCCHFACMTRQGEGPKSEVACRQMP